MTRDNERVRLRKRADQQRQQPRHRSSQKGGRSGVKAPPQGFTGLAPGHATARALAQQHVPGNSCHLVYIQGVTGGTCCAPAPSARARYEFGLAPLSLSTTATLSGSHVISGAAVAASSPGSAVAIAMMVGGGRTPPFAKVVLRGAWCSVVSIRTRTGDTRLIWRF